MKRKNGPLLYVAVITSADLYSNPADGGVFLQCFQTDLCVGGLFPEMVPGVVPGQRSGEALINSLILAVLSCAFAVLIGTSGALGMSRRKRKTGRCRGLCVHPPHHDPGDHSGHGIFVRIFPDGTALWYGHAGDRPYHVLCALCFTMVRARLVGMDQSLEEAALDLGATKWQVFRDVILPQILPAILSGVLLAFAMSFDDVVISILSPDRRSIPYR